MSAKSLCLSITAFLLLFLGPAGCSGADQGVKGEVITAENSEQIFQRLKQELTYEEVELLNSYVNRLFPDLPEGQLPSGRTVGEMIEAQRAFLSTDQTDPVGEAETSSETDQAGIPGQSQGKTPSPVSPSEQRVEGQQARQAESTQEPAAAPAEPAPPATAVLPAGSSFQVRLSEGLSSKTNQPGDSFETILEDDLVVEGNLLAPAGSRVTGKLIDVQQSGKVKGKASMALTIDKVYVGDDVHILSCNALNFEAQSTTKRDARRIGIATGAGAIIGAIAGGGKGAAIGTAIGAGAGTGVTLATSGEEVEFAVEQLFEFSVQQDVEMKIQR